MANLFGDAPAPKVGAKDKLSKCFDTRNELAAAMQRKGALVITVGEGMCEAKPYQANPSKQDKEKGKTDRFSCGWRVKGARVVVTLLDGEEIEVMVNGTFTVVGSKDLPLA